MDYKIVHKDSQRFIALVRAFQNGTSKDSSGHSIPDFWGECYDNDLVEPLRSLHPDGKKDLYGLCSPTKETETHFNYGIGVIVDETADLSTLEELKNSGYSIWETKPLDYAVLKCFGTDGECISEMWSKFFKEFVPQTGYTQTEDTDYELYYEQGEKGLFCELWIPVRKDG